MKTCRNLGISQAFISYNNPKGNADNGVHYRVSILLIAQKM
jgi:hypothetical protein